MPWYDMNYMREVVADMYCSDSWERKVMSMPDNQVMALFYKHEENRAKANAATFKITDAGFLAKKLHVPLGDSADDGLGGGSDEGTDIEFEPVQLSFFDQNSDQKNGQKTEKSGQ